jgi:hypothetical protein
MAKKGEKKMPATATPQERTMKPVRLDLKAADHARLERKADRLGLTMAAYVRMLVLKDLGEMEGSK